ncbi:MAG: hypothetical protein ACTSXW_08520 [Candidatus Baldrarchaeia archaeon]
MAKRFVIKVKPDLNAIREMAKSKGYSDIQAEILAQLYAFNPLWIHEYNVKAVLNIADGYGVRLHTRQNRRVINIDIVYSVGHDLYNVTAYEIKGVEAEEIAKHEMIYFFQLHDVIREILRGVWCDNSR